VVNALDAPDLIAGFLKQVVEVFAAVPRIGEQHL
jgi:hypothetical protein